MQSSDSVIFATLMVLVAATPATALEYTCPADPGYCYFDVGGDGCFDAGADTGPIDADLQAGTFPAVGPPSPGSIVCPPSVRKLKLVDALAWETAPGGDIEIHGATISDPKDLANATITVGGKFAFVGKMKIDEQLVVSAQTGIEIDGLVRTGFRHSDAMILESIAGDIVLRPRAKLITKGQIKIFTTTSGDVHFQDRNVVRSTNSFVVDVQGDVRLHEPKFGKAILRITATGDVEGTGRAKLQTLIIEAAADVAFDSISNMSTIDAQSVTIGRPDPKGKVRRSGFRGSYIRATGPIVLNNFLVRSNSFEISTTGSQVDALDCRFLPEKSGSPATLDIVAAGPASVCDLTGTLIGVTTSTVSCDTVVGP